MELSDEKQKENKMVDADTKPAVPVKTNTASASARRVPRAYRITLKNSNNNNGNRKKEKQPEQPSPDKKSSVTTSEGEQSEKASPTKSSPTESIKQNGEAENFTNTMKRKSRFIKFNTDHKTVANVDATPTNDRKQKSSSFPRRKKLTNKKRAENKEVLDNIVACIVLMEEKLAKYDTDDDDGATDGATDKNVTDPVQKLDENAKVENPVEEGDDDRKIDNEKSLNRKKNRNRRRAAKRNQEKSKQLSEEEGNVKREDTTESVNEENKATESAKDEDKTTEGAKKADTTIESNQNELEISPLKKTPRLRFRHTHFLAFRVRNQNIREKVEAIQSNILNMNKDYKPGFVNIPNLHATLGVMSLNNDVGDIDKAIKALDISKNKINEVYSKATCKFIEFDTLGTFKDEFLFMNMKNNEGLELLQSMVSILKDNLLQENTSVRKDKFSPHATIMKLRNKYSLRKKGIKKIPAEMYAEQKDDYFGKEEITEILLCSLAGKKEGEFHKVLACLDLVNNKLVVSSDTKSSITQSTQEEAKVKLKS